MPAGEARAVMGVMAGRGELPTAGCIDSRTVRAAETVRATACGFARMLALTLRRLERDSLVSRTVHPTVPAPVEYELTETGNSLTFLLKALACWRKEHRGNWAGPALFVKEQGGAATHTVLPPRSAGPVSRTTS
ncbi:winged helix-turn-helix transcriptional regulator [Microtetraspora malaysiensis]|uniref:winged helix-turn-helix transcriptional regulator n=1 Tax=Microtetraspora malaysiensis TaxID=161358 RepID=UPI003D8C279A